MIILEVSGDAWGRSQRGQYIIMLVLLLAIGTGFLVFSFAGPRSVAAQRNAQTEAVLAQVKQALIGYAASSPANPTSTERPGELPCPDLANDGFDDGSCAAGAIGRVPWKTLGIPQPLDGNGETLWYAIAGPFRNKNMSSAPITSDTQGNLTVYQGSSATIQTSQAVAVLFAPGSTLGTQSRACTVGVNCDATKKCTTVPVTLTPLCNPVNYLEATGGGNNAQTGGPFIQAAASGTFNDRVLAITNADLMPLVEQRVAREMMSRLRQYKAATGVYPWADLSDGQSNGTPFTAAYNRGRFPCLNALPTNWGSGGTPTLPDWLTNGCTSVSGWAGLIYYAVAKNRLENSGNGCTTCTASNSLNLTNTGYAYMCPYASNPFSCTLTSVAGGNADVLLITPGAFIGGTRNWPTDWSPITGYFEDAQNGDNNDDDYTIPTATDPNRDRMFIMF
jgi:hypothetical protein